MYEMSKRSNFKKGKKNVITIAVSKFIFYVLTVLKRQKKYY
jgi:hypothetical protein